MTDTATRITQLETKLEELQNALYSGVLRVKHGETETQYRSAAEIRTAISDLKAELNRLNGISRKPGYIVER
jgi:hypothetical protein